MLFLKHLLLPVLCTISATVTPQNAEGTIYKSNTFSISSNLVSQGQYQARILSPTEIQSNYQSQETAFKSPRISFKFSINGLDNEMQPGKNHELVYLSSGTECVSPLIRFGEQMIDKQTVPPNTYLQPNTLLKLRVDMRSVLEEFDKKGFYTNFQGTKIYKADFKGVFVAGSIRPMMWNFDNLGGRKDLQLLDTDGDGIYELELRINPLQLSNNELKTWKQTRNTSAFPQYTSPNLIESAIYNMSVEEMEKAIEKDSTLRTGIEWPGVWTRDVSYSIILSMAYMQPKVSQNSLLRKVNANGRIIQDTGTGGAWPASTDRMIWAVAAWEIYKVTGDKNWLKKVYPIIKNSIEDDLLVAFDPSTGLMRGESSFLDWREQTYPRWMQPADIYSSKNLGTNALHFKALKVAARMAILMGEKSKAQLYSRQAEKIKTAINKYLWMPDKGYFGQYLYGRNYDLLSPRSEALGEALTVVFDVADAGRQKEIVQHTPVVDYGIPCIYPQIGDIPPYHNNAVWPFVQTYWLWAGAKAGNEKSVVHSIAAIYRSAAMFLTNKENYVADNGDWAGTQINSSNMLWSLSGNISIVLKVLFGMRFEPDGLAFQPFVPKVMTGERSLSNVKYRQAILAISMEGFGNRIKTFLLDGKVQKSAVIPTTLKGKHQVKIILADNQLADQPINIIKNTATPLTPMTERKGNLIVWSSIEGAVSYRIYRNGKPHATLSELQFMPGESGEYQVTAIDGNGLESFACEPLELFNAEKVLEFEAEKFATASKLPYQGFSGTGFVEISRSENRDLAMDIEVPEDGLYSISWQYANGNGPTNTENKCAIRTLQVDGRFAGTMVFPQRGSGEWSNWGRSNSVQLLLAKGKHQLRLVFGSQNENMNMEVNQAMLDRLVLTRIE